MKVLKDISDSFTRRVLWASLILHVLAAIFSTGYHHYDEHYQILEWAAFQMGLGDRLAWEYGAQIRSWMQPFVAFGVGKVFDKLGLFNPFVVAGFLRLLSALLGWWVTVGLVRCCSFWFPDARVRRFAVFATALAWFVPYLHARFSSENWSSLFFLLGMIPWIESVHASKQGKPALKASLALFTGACWGVAFHMRYHAGLLILPAVLWIVWYLRPQRRLLLSCALGFLALFAVGLVLDRWGYGTWVLASWKYFDVNVLQSKASEWGTAPFWFYFERYLTLAPPLSTFLVIGVVAAWWVARKFSLTWITLVFVLAHCCIAHKELRFLFPILPLTPLLTAMALQKSPFLHRFFVERDLKWSRGAAIALNGLFLLPLTFLPNRTEIAVLYKIWKERPAALYVSGINPYSVPGTPGFFYRARGTPIILREESLPLVDGHYVCSLPHSCDFLVDKTHCENLGGSLPDWAEARFGESLRSRARLLDWRLYRCDSTKN